MIAFNTELNSNQPFSTIVLKRYAVQFEELAPHQIDRLDYFLINHTISEA
jgi:hypothetical protein